eukprot:NODE_773_length_703_cov_99.380734_g704_i0.p2 GENE.NODE_773_length_703_cov_99.380734_g704_i0~~NODE_773_length_703_cov_99.380734_g704_i0.p2  ORF type:complete len:59 (+),score=19.75 NODE_773_length_703_cov_99.380734_g704_i0:355-531(+)
MAVVEQHETAVAATPCGSGTSLLYIVAVAAAIGVIHLLLCCFVAVLSFEWKSETTLIV